MQMEIPVKYLKMRNLYDYGRDGELHDFIVKEKLDGANFRFMRTEQGDVIFGSRNISPINDGTVGGIKLNDPFTSYAEWVLERIDIDKLLPNHVYFAEAMMKHSIPYQVPEDKRVVGFDVYDIEKGRWRADYYKLFEDIGLPTVKVYDFIDELEGNINPVKIADLVNSNKFKSDIDGVSDIEGIVFVDYQNQVFYKYKTERFQEVQPSKTPKANGGIKGFFDKYFTLYRISNIVYKCTIGELGYNPNNPFPSIVGHVMKDVFEEATIRDLIKTFESYYPPKPVYDEEGNNIHESGYSLRKMLEDKIRQDGDLMNQIMRLAE